MAAGKRLRCRRPGALQALQAMDQRLSGVLFRYGAAVPRPLWRLLELGGDGLVWLAIALGCALAPATHTASRSAWANFLVAWAVDLALVGLLKAAVRRSRPVYNLHGDFTVLVSVDHFSFPSGHSSRASFVAVFALVLLKHSHPGFCAAILGWALTTALSRAMMGRHYLSDVLAGLALGAVTIGIVTRGSYSDAGFLVSQMQSEAAYAAVRQAWAPVTAPAGPATAQA